MIAQINGQSVIFRRREDNKIAAICPFHEPALAPTFTADRKQLKARCSVCKKWVFLTRCDFVGAEK